MSFFLSSRWIEYVNLPPVFVLLLSSGEQVP